MKARVLKAFMYQGAKEAHKVGDTIELDADKFEKLEKQGFVCREVVDQTAEVERLTKENEALKAENAKLKAKAEKNADKEAKAAAKAAKAEADKAAKEAAKNDPK